MLKNINLTGIYFNKYRTQGFGFLGSWPDVDPEHGLAVKFVIEGEDVKSITICGHGDLIR